MRVIAGVLVCLGFAGIAQAALTINVGDHDLQPNLAGQTIEIYVSGGDLVENVDIYAKIDEGVAGTGPAFTHLDLFDNVTFACIFDDPKNNDRSSGTTNGVDAISNQLAYEGTIIPPAEDAINATGLLAVFTIDTTGWSNYQTWNFSLYSPTALGYEGDAVDLTINNGHITVPEPASLSLLLLGAGLILSRRRRSSRNNG